MPGFKPDDVSVEVQGRELHISGKIEEREHEEVLHRRSRRAGQSDYRVALPSEANSVSCEVELENGMLRLRLPKTAAAMRRRNPIRGPGEERNGEERTLEAS